MCVCMCVCVCVSVWLTCMYVVCILLAQHYKVKAGCSGLDSLSPLSTVVSDQPTCKDVGLCVCASVCLFVQTVCSCEVQAAIFFHTRLNSVLALSFLSWNNCILIFLLWLTCHLFGSVFVSVVSRNRSDLTFDPDLHCNHNHL